MRPRFLYSRTFSIFLSPTKKSLRISRPVLLNIIHLVLSRLIDSSFFSQYSDSTLSESESPVSLSERRRISSAHKIEFIFVSLSKCTPLLFPNVLGKSAKNRLNNKGLIMQPCLTPISVFIFGDNLFFILT